MQTHGADRQLVKEQRTKNASVSVSNLTWSQRVTNTGHPLHALTDQKGHGLLAEFLQQCFRVLQVGGV
jgi:hypothetical protein